LSALSFSWNALDPRLIDCLTKDRKLFMVSFEKSGTWHQSGVYCQHSLASPDKLSKQQLFHNPEMWNEPRGMVNQAVDQSMPPLDDTTCLKETENEWGTLMETRTPILCTSTVQRQHKTRHVCKVSTINNSPIRSCFVNYLLTRLQHLAVTRFNIFVTSRLLALTNVKLLSP
jgi:hypothetical protein